MRAVSLEIPDVVIPEPDVPAIPKEPDPIGGSTPHFLHIPPEVEPPLAEPSLAGSQPVGFTDPGNLGNYQQIPPFAGELFHEADCSLHGRLIYR